MSTFTPTPGLVLIGTAEGDHGLYWWTIAGRSGVHGLLVYSGTATVGVEELVHRGMLDAASAKVIPVELLPELLRPIRRCRS